ncbi:MAG: HigA family addiction module antitoxin [Deltaproteobacteria bacterium]|nr:HigA family addiction module antitoxin [Deltaproteobacteria bacterium]
MSDNSPDISAFERCVESINAAYTRLGHRLGWRFLAGPRRTFASHAPFALITLNPGGAREDPNHPRASSENSSAYWIESWKGCPPGTAPLQFQFQELFARIVTIVDASESPRAFVENRVLVAHFVPFRSPSLAALHRRCESIAFARRFWAEILAEWIPRTILTIDRVTFKNLHGIISNRAAKVVAHRRFPTGWGRCSAEAFRFRMSECGETVTLARLPHLSRFRLMSNETCRQPVQDFLDYVCAPAHQAAVPHHSHACRQGPRMRSAPRAPREGDASPPRRIDSVSHRRLGPSLRLAGIEGADLYREWETHIEDQRARAAFRLLVDVAASLPHLVLSFRKKGKLKTCCLHDWSERRPRLPYSFIVNRSWIKFYFRFREARAGKDALKRDFNSFEDGNSRGEWTVKLRTEEDVRLLLTHLRGNMKLFDRYVAVDWSASSRRERGENSIWLAVRGMGRRVEYKNPATRQEAMKYIETLLRTATAEGRRLLCGFDFPFGFPAGTAQALTGRAGWEAVWCRVAKLIEDDPRNRNNRFKVAAKLNAHFDGDGPFYGNGLQEDIPGLPRNKPRWGANLPPTCRYAESKVKSAQEVWKLLGNGSVGGQALTGIAALEHLRHCTGARVWPFETLGEGRSHVLAEIYPSLIEPDPGPEVKDRRQVGAVAIALQTLDEDGELGRYLDVPSEMPATVRQEEGLILGMQNPAGFQRAARERAVHPGEHLAEELKEVGMSMAALARLLQVPTNRITEILNGRRAVTGDTALRLGHFFGISAEFWLNLQKLYELRVAEEEAGEEIQALPTLKDRH